MHSFTTRRCNFLYNSDMSGKVQICTFASGKEFFVDGKDLLAFLANYVRNMKIAKIEQQSDFEVLFGETK